MSLKRKLFPLTIVGLFLSCGEGGGGGGETSTAKVEGTLKTSYVEGIKVCLANTSRCTYTDKNGYFQLNGKIPADLVFYLNSTSGDIIWGDYTLKRNGEIIYPLDVADNNQTVAKALGGILHALANDTSGQAEYISLVGKVITSIEDEAGSVLDVKNLEEFLKTNKNPITIKFEDNRLQTEEQIKVQPQNGTVELCSDNRCKPVNYQPVEYNWTVVIIYDGDNSLNDYVDKDIQELRKVTIPSNIKIVGLADYKNSTGGYLYETNDTTGKYELVSTTSEPHMGDPDYLYNFLFQVYDKYPSQYRALIMWDHGYAWKDLTPKQTKLMAQDETDNDYLYSYEFVEMLDKLKQDGIKLNLIGFDECLMGNTEVFWDISDYTDWSVGSELLEPGDGWYYTRLFSKVVQNPDLTPEEFAKYIVDAYAEAYANSNNITMLAANSSDIKQLVDNLNKLADRFDSDNPTVVDLFKQARENAYDIYVGGDYAANHQLIDLYSFAVQLKDTYPEAQNIVNLIDGMYKKIVGNDEVKGLSIFFPLNKDADDPDYYCTKGDITCLGYYNPFTVNKWDEFLKEYLNATSSQ